MDEFGFQKSQLGLGTEAAVQPVVINGRKNYLHSKTHTHTHTQVTAVQHTHIHIHTHTTCSQKELPDFSLL